MQALYWFVKKNILEELKQQNCNTSTSALISINSNHKEQESQIPQRNSRQLYMSV